MTYHYTRDDIKKALKDVGVCKGDTIFCHSNIGFWGHLKDAVSSSETLNTVLTSILEMLGEEGTFIVPTYTYSFGKEEIYDLFFSKSNCGLFSEFVRQSPKAVRSLDPSVSVSAIGEKAYSITENLPENAYDTGSFFDRFLRNKGKIINFNMDAGSTFIHYVERMLGVSYRFDKTFSGKIQVGNEIIPKKSTLWVRHISPDTEVNFENFHRFALDKKAFNTQIIGRGFIGAISAEATFDLVSEAIKIDTHFLTKKYFYNS